MTERGIVLEGLRAGYGEAIVLDGVSLAIERGDSLAVLGRNGVGKTTLLATIMGHTKVVAGRMVWHGADLLAMPAYQRARAGLAWVVQERDIFPSLTVEENLTVAARPGDWTLERVYTLFPRLKERRRNMGNRLSGGEQQMLAIGRALTGNPSLLLLDEPLEGLAPIIVGDLSRAIRELVGQSGFSIILVEQHARMALAMTSQTVVLERGRIVYAGSSAALSADTPTLERLLGIKTRPA